MNVYDVVLVLANAFILYIIKRYVALFSDRVISKKLSVLAYILFWCATTTCHFVFDYPLLNLIVTLVCMFLIFMTYQMTLGQKILQVAFLYLIMFGVEILVSAVTGRIQIDPLEKGNYNNALGLFVCKIMTFFVVLMIENIKRHRANHSLPLPYLLTTIFIPISSVVLGVMVAGVAGITPIYVVVAIFILMMMNAVAFALYDALMLAHERQMEAMIYQKETLYYQNQVKLMQESVDETRKFRHDFQNHLKMIEEMLTTSHNTEAKEYLQQLHQKGRQREGSIVTSGNLIVDSVLNYKLAQIQELPLKLNLDIYVPSQLDIEIADLVVILTNLLDNAIEALRKCSKNSELMLNIRISYTKGRLLLCIRNTYCGEICYENGRISTSKSETRIHGLGIINVREAVEKYKGLLKMSHEENVFTAQVLVYL